MKAGRGAVVLDPEAVRRRRGELGLTESYLGARCGVSGGVIRRFESGWPQDDLSIRFVTLLAERLSVPFSALVLTEEPGSGAPEQEPSTEPAPAAQLGALLHTAGEPVPLEAVCEVLGWNHRQLDEATGELHRALEHVGAVLVDAGDALSIASDVTAVSADEARATVKAAFAKRRPNLPELRIVNKLLEGKIVRLEDLGTACGMTIARLRSVGVLNSPGNVNMKSDPPEQSKDVRFSLTVEFPQNA